MNVGLVVVISIVALLLVVAGALFWWVNRPLQTAPAGAHTLPLFGSDIVIAPVPIVEDDDELDHMENEDGRVPVEPQMPTPAAVAAVVGGSDSPGVDKRAFRFAPPSGAHPGAISRVDRYERPAESQVLMHAQPRADLPADVRGTASPLQMRDDKPGYGPSPALGHAQQNGRQSFAAEAHHHLSSAPAHAHAPSVAANANRSAVSHSAPHAPRTPARPTANMFEGQSVRFSIPTDGTLQFLPGRLEITAGQDIGREIRFVRLPDPEGTRVTFGRLDGPLYRHVQLHDPTVSRMHASMHIVDGEWQLTNLSTTNPVVYNNRLLGEGETLSLADGDRVEMGEVVFRFRNR